MFRYDLESILEANGDSTVVPRHQSRAHYFVDYENNYAILPDENSILGVSHRDRSVLLLENLTGHLPLAKVAEHSSKITTVIPNSTCSMILVGDKAGTLVLYSFLAGCSEFKVIRDFGSAGVGSVTASCRIGHLVALGGKNGMARFFDFQNKSFVSSWLKTAVQWVYSLRFIATTESRLVLCMAGKDRNYSNFGTDMFDVTQMVREFELKASSSGFKSAGKRVVLLRKRRKICNF